MKAAASVFSTFVGRKTELRFLAEQVAAAKGGHGRFCLLSGETGIGKSRLLDQVTRESFAEGVRFVRARFGAARPADSGRVWSRVVRDCIAGGSRSEQVESGVAGARVNPSGLLASSLGQRGQDWQVSDHSQIDTESIAESLKILLLRASEAQPLVIVLDDLHNAESLTREFLGALSAQLEGLPVLMIGAANDDRAAYELPQRTFASAGEHYRLGPLSYDETGEMVSFRTGESARSAFVAQVYSLSGGNPMLIREVLKQAPLADSREATWMMLSPRARAAIHGRLSGFSREARRVLAVAAVINGDLIPAVLGAASELRSEAMVAALDELIRAGLIRTARPGRSLTLAMDIAGEAALSDLPAGERFRIHRRVAEALRSLDRDGTGVHSGAIASHYVASLDPSVIPEAVAHSRAAGSAAIRERNFAQAVRMYSLAAQALDLAGEDRGLERFEVHLALGESHQRSGNHLLAEQAFRRAAELAERLGDYRLIARLVAKQPLIEWPVSLAHDGLTLMLGAQVLGRHGAGADAEIRACVEARYAAALALSYGEEVSGEELGESALALATRAGGPATLAQVLLLRRSLLEDPDRLKDRLECASKLNRIAAELGDYRALFLARRTAALAHLEAGRTARADAEAELMKRAAALSREPLGRLVVQSYRGVRALMEGRFGGVEQELNAGPAALDGHELLSRSVLCWPALVVPFEQQGRLAELEPQVAEAREQAGHLWSYTAMQSWFYCKLGKYHEASLYLERAVEGLNDAVRRHEGYLAALAALSEVVTQLGDMERAATLYERLSLYPERNLLLGSVAIFGCASRYLGILARILNHTDHAIAHLTHAATINRRIGARPWAAFAEFDLAVALAARAGHGERARAQEICDRVQSEARAMGMEKLAAQVQELRKQLSAIRPNLGRPEPSSTPRLDRLPNAGHAHETGRDGGRRPTAAVPSGTGLKAVRDQVQTGENRPDTDAPHLFRREGELWTLAYEGKVVRVRHRKGLTILAYLLQNAGRRFHALELSALLDHRSEQSLRAKTQEMLGSKSEPLLDTQAKQSYRKRLRELRAEIEEAKANNDVMRAERMEEESAYLTRELARALGIFGRDRRLPSDAERARLRVTWVVRSATNLVSAQHASLGRFLRASIRTGAYLSYRPTSDIAPDWQF